MELNYTKKEAKNLRIEIRKMAAELRSQSVGYPDQDVRETISDIWEWSKKEGCLNQALRRAYDLHCYILFNLEDNTKGYTEWYDPIEVENGKKPVAFSLTEAQIDFAMEVDEFCVHCANVIALGDGNPAEAFTLHDGSDAPPRPGRAKQGTRRSDTRFNRDIAKKESLEDFKAAKAEKNAEEYKALTTMKRIDAVEVPEDCVEMVNGLLDALNTRIKPDNFSLSDADVRGGCIIVLRGRNGFRVMVYDQVRMPRTQFEVVAVIYIKSPLVFSDPNGYMYATSFIDVCIPVADSYFHTLKLSDSTNTKRKKNKQDTLNSLINTRNL